MNIRPAVDSDLDIVVDYFRAMLDDMACYGGHPVATRDEDWQQVIAGVADEIQREDCFWYLAEDTAKNIIGTCGGFIVKLDFGFLPKKNLHIGAVYVRPENRNQGIGRMLMQQAIRWGKNNNCTDTQLNVLEHNPARHLYESLGFETFERKLILSDH